MHNLAWALEEAGDPNGEAPALLRRLLELVRRTLGDTSTYAFMAVNNLAVALANAGQSDEAVRLHRETLEARKQSLGEQHPDTLTSVGNLAVALSKLGQHEEAIGLHRELLEVRQLAQGPNHTDVLCTMHNLAVALGMAGQDKEAAALQQRACDLWQDMLDHRNPDGLRRACSHGLEQSPDASVDVSALKQQLLGEQPLELLPGKYHLGSALYELGQGSDATSSPYREVVELMQQVLCSPHANADEGDDGLPRRPVVIKGQHPELLEVGQGMFSRGNPDTLVSHVSHTRKQGPSRVASFGPRKTSLVRFTSVAASAIRRVTKIDTAESELPEVVMPSVLSA
jgi:tetratricopeptide (TPR) repeat protein